MEKNKYKKFIKNILEKDEIVEHKKVYYKPSKIKLIFGFIFSLIIMIILLRIGFQFTMMYLLIFLGDLVILSYYVINLFTKEGILLPKYVKVKKDSSSKEEE